MKKALIVCAALVALCSLVAVAGLDSSGLTYTTVADNVTVSDGSQTNLTHPVSVADLKGNGKIILVDTVVTAAGSGAPTYTLLTGVSTSVCATAVSGVTFSTGASNTSAIATSALDTETLGAYLRVKAVTPTSATSGVRKVSAVLVTY